MTTTEAVNDIVLEFNDMAQYQILKEYRDIYHIYDKDCDIAFKVSKKDWLEKIRNYYNNEFTLSTHQDLFIKNKILKELDFCLNL